MAVLNPTYLSPDVYGIVSYNLHGLNNGRSLIMELCDNPLISVIAIQEHWLTPNNLHLLNSLHPDFVGFGISAMSNRLGTEIYRGRPYGGVGFLWRKCLANHISIIGNDKDCRCLAVSWNTGNNNAVKIISVYFPCFDSSVKYSVDLGYCLGFLEDNINNGDDVIVLGDFNFECDQFNSGYLQCTNVFDSLAIITCDDLCKSCDRVTYVNNSLNHSSFIDHMFVSRNLKPRVRDVIIYDSGINFSDHRALVGVVNLNLQYGPNPPIKGLTSDHKRFAWRWDKSDVSQYYYASYHELKNISIPFDCVDCACNCLNTGHHGVINSYYGDIVHALSNAANNTVYRVPCNALKAYWNDELDQLKQDSILWHNIWFNAGRPSSGTLHHIKCSAKARYKAAIRDAYANYEGQLSDDLLSHFLHKRIPEFWKCWNIKFRKNVSRQVVINGLSNDSDIADEFAKHFRSVYVPSVVNHNIDELCSMVGSSQQNSPMADSCLPKLITVELINNCVNSLKLGKACGPDDLGAEHLHYAHPLIFLHLKVLFYLIFTHNYVPDAFGIGISVPLLKDKSGNINDVNNYRAITLIPIISKVFENVILALCENHFITDPLQFGFKRGIGCCEAIFTFKSVINHFTDRGSSVYVASLDVSKAFDKVNHFKLYMSLLNAGIPLSVIKILFCWYSKLFVSIRWQNGLSEQFRVHSGVRQGSILSPSLFNLFVNIFTVNLRMSEIGCHMYNQYFGCLLYADDLIILSPSVNGLQDMLNICYETASSLDLSFNANKCHCITFGKHCKMRIDAMAIGPCRIEWCDSFKYLGTHIVGGKRMSFDVGPIKRSFFSACNCIFAQADKTNEILHLSLQEYYCLPILMYASSGCSFSKRQLSELNSCWNTLYRKIFNFNKWESVKCFICGLGKLDLHHLLLLSRLKFYKKLSMSSNYLLRDLFWSYAVDYSHCESFFKCVFMSFSSITDFIHKDFNLLCNL